MSKLTKTSIRCTQEFWKGKIGAAQRIRCATRDWSHWKMCRCKNRWKLAVDTIKIGTQPNWCRQIFRSILNDDLSRRSNTIAIPDPVQSWQHSTWMRKNGWFLLSEQCNYSNDIFLWIYSSIWINFDVSFSWIKANTKKINDAIGENLLDHFTMTLKPATNVHTSQFIAIDFSISGQIQSCNKEYIFVKFTNENFNSIRNNLVKHKRKFDIVFHANRAPFQLQHTALDCLKKHNLFHCLINNSAYDTMPDCSIEQGNHIFR